MRPRPQIPGGPYLVVGLARSGEAAARALAGRGARVIGVDAGAPEGAARLADAGVELHLGADGSELLAQTRCVVKSPGVPAQAAVIAAARARGIPVLGELELAWRMLPNAFIAVTGTNGKTTTVELIGHIYRQAPLPVAVAGNVGTAASSLVGSLKQDATVICEASSFQLEDTSAFAPEVAVLLNLAEDHLDRHRTMAAYVAAKLEIFARQDERDVAIAPAELLARLAHPRAGDPVASAGGLPRLGRARRLDFGPGAQEGVALSDGRLLWHGEELLDVADLRMRGAHNVQNAMAAATACLARGVEREAVRAGLHSFTGVTHRLEEVACREGVLYVNDSKATNVASTLVALQAFPGAPVHLILGGQGKDQDFSRLGEPVRRSCRAVYLIGEDAGMIEAALANDGVRALQCDTLERALQRARAGAVAGEVVLLSPGCASFDQFADFHARGERFRELVANGGFAQEASK